MQKSETISRSENADFSRMHTNLAPRVLGYLHRRTRNRAEAEDLTQETFVAAYAARSTYNGNAAPIGWLLGIARRRLRDKTRSALPLSEAIPDDTESADDPEAQVVRAAHLQACLAQLDSAHRDALLLVFGQGYTYAEAAQSLNEPIGTVKWRVHAASRQMRELLRDADEEKLP